MALGSSAGRAAPEESPLGTGIKLYKSLLKRALF